MTGTELEDGSGIIVEDLWASLSVSWYAFFFLAETLVCLLHLICNIFFFANKFEIRVPWTSKKA